jgi:uncharacterized protein
MADFLPWHGLAGGALIGLSAAFYWLVAGRVSGISGIVDGALKPWQPRFGASFAYVVGLGLGALLVRGFAPSLVPTIVVDQRVWLVAVAGVLVGFGARLGSGCTSGHGVCGLPRLSRRSWVATATFMATAIVVAVLVRTLIGR